MPVHALHLSTFEMIYNTKNQHATVRMRVFEDDLIDAIKNANPDLPAVNNLEFVVVRMKEIEQYFQQHFQLNFDGQTSTVRFTNGHVEGDVYWLHLDLIFPEKTQNCTLQADYLMELFDDQSNIGTVILNGEKQFFRFTQRDAIFQIALSN